eukprot:COSAG05_NODE_135_length_16947_cov_294.166548_13_plen_109_part_00
MACPCSFEVMSFQYLSFAGSAAFSCTCAQALLSKQFYYSCFKDGLSKKCTVEAPGSSCACGRGPAELMSELLIGLKSRRLGRYGEWTSNGAVVVGVTGAAICYQQLHV